MKTIVKKERMITMGTVILLLMSLICTGFFYIANTAIKKDINDEKLKTEKMLSEKLSFEREIDDFRNQVNLLNGKNSELDKMLAQINEKLGEKELEVIRIARENGNSKLMKKQLAELTQMKKDLEGKILALNGSIQKLNTEKDALNQTVTSLQEENKNLAANLDILSSMTADNYLIETTKRNDKLTILSKRAKKISVSFKVPENVVEKISFKLTKPDGSKVEGTDKGFAYQVINNDENLMASLLKNELKVSKKIEMTYEPKDKLQPGIYKIEMFNGTKYIGSCNVKLR